MARRQNAWLTPDNGDTTVVGGCLYVPRVLVPMVTGALSALTEQWNWEQVGTMTVDEATQLATVMLLNWELTGCSGDMNCDDVIACLLDSGILDDFSGKEYRIVDGVPQWSFDGETWTDFTEEPQPPYAPPATPTPGNDNAERICLAATRAVNTINELHRQTWGVIQEGLADIATTFMIRMRDTLATLVSLWYGEVGAVVFGELLRIGAANPSNFTTQGMTEQEKEDFLCLLIEHATVTGGIVSFDFGAVRDNAVAALGLVIGPDIYLLLQYIQSEGLNASGQVNNAADANCDACLPEWCMSFSDTFDGAAPFWAAAAKTTDPVKPTGNVPSHWSISGGNLVTVAQSQRWHWAGFHFDTPQQVHEWHLNWIANDGGGSPLTQVIYLNADNNPVTISAAGFRAANNSQSGNLNGLAIRGVFVGFWSANDVRRIYLENASFTLRGVGQNPYGLDNC